MIGASTPTRRAQCARPSNPPLYKSRQKEYTRRWIGWGSLRVGRRLPEEMESVNRYVDITFDCLPLRSIGRVDIPIDASPKYRARCERILKAMESHGTFNTYYLYNARCTYHLTNTDAVGMLEFHFEGTVMTDASDQQTERTDLDVTLVRETCDWLTEPVVAWLVETVRRAVLVEFDRYIAAGDLKQTISRVERLQKESDQSGGFVGMYL